MSTTTTAKRRQQQPASAKAPAANIPALGARVCLAADARRIVYLTVGEEWYGVTRALRLVRAAETANPLAVRYVAPATACVLAPRLGGLWEGQVA